MGANVAQAVSLLYHEYFQGVLVILDIAPVEYCRTADQHRKAVCDAVDLLVETTTDQSALQLGIMNKRVLDQALTREIPDANVRAFLLANWDDRAKRWKVKLQAIQKQLHILAGFDQACLGKQYPGDVLLIHVGQSSFVISNHSDTVESYFPRKTANTIHDSGHWLHAEKPHDIVLLLRQFLN